MIAVLLEGGLEAELDDELGYTKYDYRNKSTTSRNGRSKKTLHSSHGDIDISVPRDRESEFEPKLVKKDQTSLSGDIEEKILSMYAKGMTTSDIEAHIKEIPDPQHDTARLVQRYQSSDVRFETRLHCP